MSRLPDPIREGLQRGWKVLGGAHAALPEKITCDVVIIGSGAGAGITAELLARAGLRIVIVEEGPLKSSSDFHQKESEAYPALYQESAGRKTEDKAISILQGRCVGGSTTVNWTSSFRTPDSTLAYWQQAFGLTDFTPQTLRPFFEQAERRLGIAPWSVLANENNAILRRGADKLGIETGPIARNVRGCWNLGSCGLGCPTNAKQSMLVTTIPTALDHGATLLVETQAQRLEIAKGRVQAVHCVAVKANGEALDSVRCTLLASHVVLAGGAINSPALLLRSGAVDPHGNLGQRTFLHPIVSSAAVFEHRVEGWAGAPQSVYSDHYLEPDKNRNGIGFKLEVPSMHPVVLATTLPGHGTQYTDLMKRFPHMHAMAALMKDGFHEEASGGQVKLRDDGSPSLDYPLTPYIMDGARHALLAMAELQFAAGARLVLPLHEQAREQADWASARRSIQELDMRPHLTKVLSAHVMGGCGLGADESLGVARPDGGHWQIENLSIHDGSLFPTSIGANPQLSIYAIANRLAQGLVRRLTGHEISLA